MTELTLHTPSDKELSYRGYLISDEETMSYNMGYGDNGGCTYHKTAEELLNGISIGKPGSILCLHSKR